MIIVRVSNKTGNVFTVTKGDWTFQGHIMNVSSVNDVLIGSFTTGSSEIILDEIQKATADIINQYEMKLAA